MTTKNERLAEAAWAEWVHNQPHCTWLNCGFRITSAPELIAISRALKAMQWSVDDLARRLNKGIALRFVPYHGGEPDNDVASHVHALLELPKGKTMDEVRGRLETQWPYFLERQFKRRIYGTVWLRPYEPNQAEEQKYFMRQEGSTFSRGLEKVIVQHVRLD